MSEHGGKKGGGGEADDAGARIIHARVPKELDSALRRRARESGVPISSVVRQTLANTLCPPANTAAGDGGGSSRMGWVSPAAPQPSTWDRGRLLGWQELVMAANAVCEVCNRVIGIGDRAALAIFQVPSPATIACLDCMAKSVDDARAGAR